MGIFILFMMVVVMIFKHIPTQDELDLSKDASYLHICANNTIYGTEWKYVPETNGRTNYCGYVI